MALIRHLEKSNRAAKRTHKEAEATFCIVPDDGEGECLQIDTFGSADREQPGKVSQSIRFSAAAVAELRLILAQNF